MVMQALVAHVWFLQEVVISLLVVVFDEGSEVFLGLELFIPTSCSCSVRLSAHIASG